MHAMAIGDVMRANNSPDLLDVAVQPEQSTLTLK
jgi:hypothetical protein